MGLSRRTGCAKVALRTEGPPMQHEQTADLPYLRKVVGASMAGTVVEWYEFFLYGTAATLVFGQLFFPDCGWLARDVQTSQSLMTIASRSHPFPSRTGP